MSAALDAPFDRLLVHPCAIGGDFGGKGDFMDVALCYVLSRRIGRPVKMIMDSAEEFLAGNPRHAGVIRVKTGVTRDGPLMSQHMDFVFDSGAYGAFKPMGLLLGAQKAVGPYRIPHTLQEERMVYTNKVPCGLMRVGLSPGRVREREPDGRGGRGAGHGPGGVQANQPDARGRRVSRR